MRSRPASTSRTLSDARPSLLAIHDLLLERGRAPILRVSDFELFEGEVVALIGPSGCGKSTLLATISGAFPATAGSLVFPSRELDDRTRTYVSRGVQGAPLFHWLTVRENLMRAATIKGVKGLDCDKVLSQFAADELGDRYPTSLSGGERCRASLSQALVGDPRVLLLDEPFTGLDVAVKRFVAENIFRLARDAGAGVIMVTHDLYDAIEYADRVVVLGERAPARIVGEFDAKIDVIETIAGLLVQ